MPSNLHGLLNTSTSEPDNSLTPLKERQSPHIATEPYLGTHTLPEVRPESYQLAEHIEGDTDESKSDVITKSQHLFIGKTSSSHPGIKSRVAEPALTKTDIHAFTLVSTRTLETSTLGANAKATTPTIRIVRSSNSCFEVPREGMPADDKQRDRHRNSIAGLALRAASPATEDGLDRVNSKVPKWSSGRVPDLEVFAPQIVAFPDDEGRAHAVTSTKDGTREAVIIAASISGKTIGARSCSSSMSQPSTSPSQDESDPVERWDSNDVNDNAEETIGALAVPNAKAAIGVFTTPLHKTKQPLADRRLSNIDDAEVRFRGHRDSVIIARSRLSAERVGPAKLFEVRTYNPAVRRQIYALKRGASEEAIATAKVVAWEPFESRESACWTSSLPVSPVDPLSPMMNRHSETVWGMREAAQIGPAKGRNIDFEE